MTEERVRVSGVGMLLGTVALLAGSTVAVAAPPPETSVRDGSTRPLVVALAEGPPFAIKDADGAWSGLSVELWREIAAGLELRWEPLEIELEQVDSVLRDGRADATLGAVAIDAEGEMSHDFSLPTSRPDWDSPSAPPMGCPGAACSAVCCVPTCCG